MTPITEEEFGQHVLVHGDPLCHEERGWFRLRHGYGVVISDKIDGDWSFVVLQPDEAGVNRFVDGGTGFGSQGAATEALGKKEGALYPLQERMTEWDTAFHTSIRKVTAQAIKNGGPLRGRGPPHQSRIKEAPGLEAGQRLLPPLPHS